MKKNLTLLFMIIFLAFCFIIFYKGLNKSSTYFPKINKKIEMPTFVAKDFNSSTYLDSEKIFNEDTFYIINIWASWCVPCRTEHPFLMRLSKNQSVKLIGVNYKDSIDNAKKFIDEFGNPYSQIIIDNDGTLSIEFGAYGVPETFIIDKGKKIIKKFTGPINQDIVEEIKIIVK
jgi:cytochrome c biogenesis protein CcmG, thiol:disulfide interchange protein DsbE|tara:strand:- start:40 stop:561 length:522 start_codon:yes stop_codon:yes gene_type:complete